MYATTTNVDDYFDKLPEERKEAMQKLRIAIKENLPDGFEEMINYGMPAFVVPHKLYPKGYHCKPSLPLGFINIASQKNFIALYHMGMFADDKLLHWFKEAYSKLNIGKPDMGKSCIRFKKTTNIPFKLIEALAKKVTVKQWIENMNCY